MIYLGVNIYCSDSEQRRLLHELGSWVIEAREQGLCHFFTYRRFDARGPHVFALFNGEAGLHKFLEARVRGFLETCPAAPMRAEEIRRRHRQCRGRTLCALDRQAAFADNNSFAFFEPSPDDYPLALSHRMGDARGFWDCVDTLTLWTMEKITQGAGNSAAVRWLAIVTQSLARCGVPSHEYWKYHVQKLLPVLEQNAASLEEMHYWLQHAVSDANKRLFSPVWEQSMTDSGETAIDATVNAIFRDRSGSPEERFPILHEVSDLVLHQLYQPTGSQTIMVLYALDRSLEDAPLASVPASGASHQSESSI